MTYANQTRVTPNRRFAAVLRIAGAIVGTVGRTIVVGVGARVG